MKCKAIQDGYFNRYIKIGETVDWPKKVLPSWLVAVESKVNVKDSPSELEDVKRPSSEEMEKELQKTIDMLDGLEELRTKAKELGYKYSSVAGKNKLQKYIAEHEE